MNENLVKPKKTTFVLMKETNSTSYPVGRYIVNNVPIIKDMIATFNSIKEFKGKEMNIICMGSSGAIVATLFALELPKARIVHIKKDGENSHSMGIGLNTDAGVINVIVDDFISTGETINTIYTKLRKPYPTIVIDALCVSGYSRHSNLTFEPKYMVCGIQD